MSLMKNTFNKIKALFVQQEDDSSKNSRIESARVTSNRLQALQRMRMNSPTTPDYKLEKEIAEASPTNGARGTSANPDNIDLDFGMEIGRA